MGKIHNHSMFNYLLVLCLSITLLLAQTGQLHMHLEHAESSAHAPGVHPESTLHDVDLTDHHDSHLDNHSAAAVDVSPDTLLKKTNFLNLLVIIFFFTGFILCIPHRTGVFRQKFDKPHFPTCYYLFHPPLRAPPIK
jgi:hypothetical protein